MGKSIEDYLGNDLYCKLNNAVQSAGSNLIDIKEFDERYTMILNKVIKDKSIPDSIISTLNTVYMKVRKHYDRGDVDE